MAEKKDSKPEDSEEPQSQKQREITTGRDSFEHVEGDVYTGPITIHQYPTPETPRIPMQRPPRPQHFIGREQELAQLLSDLKPGKVITLCGPGGIGKSALAAEVIWRLAPGDEPPEQFPAGIIWHDFYTEPQADLALENIARVFEEEPQPTPFEAAKRALSGRKVLILLDGTENADNLPELLKITGNSGVIVTSRKRQDAVAERQDIQSLQADEAVQLLRAWGKEQVDDETVVRPICDLVGGLPLAVRLVGRYLDSTGESATEYLQWLEETSLEALNQGGRKLESVPLLIKRSVTQVSESARQALAVLGQLAFTKVAVAPIAAALNHPTRPTQRALGELVNYGLLFRSRDRNKDHYKTSHVLIHTYARERLISPEATVEHAVGYYIDFANNCIEGMSVSSICSQE